MDILCQKATHHPADFNCSVTTEQTDQLRFAISLKSNTLKGQITIPSMKKIEPVNHEQMKHVLRAARFSDESINEIIGSNSQCWIIWSLFLILAVTEDGLDLLDQYFNFEAVEFADPVFILTCICHPVHNCIERINQRTKEAEMDQKNFRKE